MDDLRLFLLRSFSSVFFQIFSIFQIRTSRVAKEGRKFVRSVQCIECSRGLECGLRVWTIRRKLGSEPCVSRGLYDSRHVYFQINVKWFRSGPESRGSIKQVFQKSIVKEGRVYDGAGAVQ